MIGWNLGRDLGRVEGHCFDVPCIAKDAGKHAANVSGEVRGAGEGWRRYSSILSPLVSATRPLQLKLLPFFVFLRLPKIRIIRFQHSGSSPSPKFQKNSKGFQVARDKILNTLKHSRK